MSLTERQLAIRRGGLTATDMRVLAGVDPFGRTLHDVWSSKCLGVEDFEETEAIELGMALEPIVIPRLAKKVGYHVLRVDPEKLTMVHPNCRTHIATPDALLARTAFHDPEATAQIKVCGLHTAGAWGKPEDGADGVPEHVLIQVAWELHVAMQPVAFVGALIGTEVRAYRVELTRDVAELIDALSENADRFWTDHVLTKRPPVLDGSEGAGRMLKSLFPRARGPMARASADIEQAARTYLAATREIGAAQEKKELAKQLLIAACGDGEGILGQGWRLRYAQRAAYKVEAHEVAEGRRFDLRETGPAKARGRKEEAA